jgi:hypothetical protein
MKRFVLVCAAGCWGILGGSLYAADPAASLLYDNIFSRPTVSPYLNLLNPAGAVGLPNYFTLVRPQVEARAGLSRQAAQLQQLNRQVSTNARRSRQGPSQVRSTGHPTQFMYYGPYYRQLGPRR